MKKRILISGAAGAIGFETLKKLLLHLDKYEIRVLAKKTFKHKRLLDKYRNKTELIYGDIRDKNCCDTISKGVDFVIHLAAVIPPKADFNTGLTKEVNVDGTKNLINSLEINSPNAFFLYTSSISVYGDRLANPWIKVGDKLLPSKNDYYGQTKIEAESIVQRTKLNWSIFRLTAIMHPKQEIDPLMFHMPLETKMEICTTDNTATALIKAIENPEKLNGKIFNLGGGEKCRVTYEDFLNNCLKLSGLGENAFPKKAFALNNFHCGYYEDTNSLNDILNFQTHTINDYYQQFGKESAGIKKLMASIFKPIIVSYFLYNSKRLNSKYYKKNHPA